MPEPRPVVEVVRHLLSSGKAVDPEKTLHLLSELTDAIDKCPAAHFEPVTTIESLLPYFAPIGTRYGDNVVEEFPADVSCTKSAGASITVLASIVRRFSSTAVWPETLQRLIGCWPSTCMGLRFYSRALVRKSPPPPVLEIDSPAHTFTAVVTLLQMYSGVDSLAALVRNTREATDLIIKLWVLEVRHIHLSAQLKEMFPDVAPPTAAGLLHNYLFARRDLDTCGSLLVSTLEGSLGHTDIASVGLEHVRQSTSTLSRHAAVHIMHANLLNLGCMHSKPLHAILISQNSVRVVTEALMALTLQPFETATADVAADCMAQICEYLHKYIASDGLASLNQSLELGLVLGLVKAHPWLDVKRSAFDAFLALVAVHLPRYLIYISVLRQVHKSLELIQQLPLQDMLSNVQSVWLAFEKYARIRLALASEAELRPVLCSHSQCSQPSSSRCSGCWEAVYCSKACQTAAWNTHGGPCKARIKARLNGIPPDLAEEDVQFALRAAQRDFEEHKAAICARWTAAGTLPLRAGIDYSVFPHTTRTDTPGGMGAQMSADAVMYSVFPQGTAGTEYYMCDLGLTREAGATDEETIRVVVQMVSAQAVPAFFRIN
ncbi:hypothetical protein DFH09DRAFT_657678 [Mycena vulgaris]|nr:hypothetical protein DFH09DRAFT_657678 [Mycena vulgaris]